MHVLHSEGMVALGVTWHDAVLDPLSNSLSSDLSPSGLWEPGLVLEGDDIYPGYSERFSVKFPPLHEVA